MNRSVKRICAIALFALAALVLPAGASAAVPGPAWSISAEVRSPTVFARGETTGEDVYTITAANIGSEPTNGGTITITDFLPPGVTLNPSPSKLGFSFTAYDRSEVGYGYPCEVGPPVRCTFATTVAPGEELTMQVPVNVDAGAPAVVTNQASVSGGGATGASTSVQTQVSSSPAPFGFQSLSSSLLDASGSAETRAGAHPYSLRIAAQFNTVNDIGTSDNGLPAENPRNIVAELPAGLVANPRATPVRCTEVQLETSRPGGGGSECPDASAIGVVRVNLSLFFAKPAFVQPLYNMVPPAGRPAEFGFDVFSTGIIIHLLGHVRSDGEVGLGTDTLDITQLDNMSGVTIEMWGNPSDPSHNGLRGICGIAPQFGEECPVPANDTPLLTLPSACSGPLTTSLSANSWQHPENYLSAGAHNVDAAGSPVGVSECDRLPYVPSNEVKLSTDQAESGTALDFNLDFPNQGWEHTSVPAESTTRKAVVTLPEGVTINPSVGEGLGYCTPPQYAKEKTFSIDGEGCPSDSKIGTLHVDTPLLADGVDGSVYLAQQDNPSTTEHGAENPFDTDIALYLVLRNAQLGILVKRPMKVEADPNTGQLVATAEELPQLPFSHFNFHFKEGSRAALVSPSTCGTYTTVGKFYPYSDPGNPKVVTSDFTIDKGVNGGSCPSGGVPPFNPEFRAGSVNNNAKSYSPFDMRLIRHDGEQDMTKFSTVLPPGVLGKLAGISKCSDGDIASAKGKTGRQEEAAASCPANSEIGHTIAGAGVGDSLTYVPGKLYLAGPYNGDPLSVVSVTPALAGPFDAGTVVVREALTLNPETAEVEVDGAASDPIPHILKGIVLKVRDLRVYVDKPEFILNPTSCEESSARATLFGSGGNVFSTLDDVPVPLSTRYQAASCASLPFQPHLKLLLRGGAKRGAHPALRAVVKARPHDANIGGAVVTLPRSAFLDQGHIRTICTRVQYAANGGSGGGCPKAARYGYAKAWTPLLDEPVQGPVYLRSSNHKLPDLVAALHGIVNVDIVGRIDSFKGGIRSSFETVPDAPVSRFLLRMQGGKKGLVVNSRNLCFKPKRNRATARFTGQNGVPHNFRPLMRAQCHKKGRKHRRHGGHRRTAR